MLNMYELKKILLQETSSLLKTDPDCISRNHNNEFTFV